MPRPLEAASAVGGHVGEATVRRVASLLAVYGDRPPRSRRARRSSARAPTLDAPVGGGGAAAWARWGGCPVCWSCCRRRPRGSASSKAAALLEELRVRRALLAERAAGQEN